MILTTHLNNIPLTTTPQIFAVSQEATSVVNTMQNNNSVTVTNNAFNTGSAPSGPATVYNPATDDN